jgi:DnaJ-class molecular chaperone
MEPPCERGSKERGDKRMSAMEQFYQILKLKLGATAKQSKQTYEDLVNMWDPEEFSRYPYLQQIAYQRKKQIELAYEAFVGEWVRKNCQPRRK